LKPFYPNKAKKLPQKIALLAHIELALNKLISDNNLAYCASSSITLTPGDNVAKLKLSLSTLVSYPRKLPYLHILD
jgi:hypothetical protein